MRARADTQVTRRRFFQTSAAATAAIAASMPMIVNAQLAAPPSLPATVEAKTVNDAATVLEEIMKIPASAIPESLLRDSRGLVIVPGMLKLGFIASIQRGEGVLLICDPATNQWKAPTFVTLTGGGAGFQAGVQSADIILVLRTEKSVESAVRKDRQFTLGVDAGVAAGPIGRQTSLSTDIQMRSEILSYSRSRGLFLGAAIDGMVMDMDHAAGQRYNATTPSGQTMPPEAKRLVDMVQQFSGAPLDLETIRQNLAAASNRLQSQLDAQWKTYLALPPEVGMSGQHPSVAALREVEQKYATVAGNSEYAILNSRPEFSEVQQLLGQYASQLERPAKATSTLEGALGTLPQMPAPPGAAAQPGPAPLQSPSSGFPDEPAFPSPTH